METFYHVAHTTQMSGEAEHFYFRSYSGAYSKFLELIEEVREQFADGAEITSDEDDIKNGDFHCDDGEYYHTIRIHEVKL